jgi:hypothetical protein
MLKSGAAFSDSKDRRHRLHAGADPPITRRRGESPRWQCPGDTR